MSKLEQAYINNPDQVRKDWKEMHLAKFQLHYSTWYVSAVKLLWKKWKQTINKEQVMKYVELNLTEEQIAWIYSCSVSRISQIKQEYKKQVPTKTKYPVYVHTVERMETTHEPIPEHKYKIEGELIETGMRPMLSIQFNKNSLH